MPLNGRVPIFQFRLNFLSISVNNIVQQTGNSLLSNVLPPSPSVLFVVSSGEGGGAQTYSLIRAYIL
jgi:hypothetical protein